MRGAVAQNHMTRNNTLNKVHVAECKHFLERQSRKVGVGLCAALKLSEKIKLLKVESRGTCSSVPSLATPMPPGGEFTCNWNRFRWARDKNVVWGLRDQFCVRPMSHLQQSRATEVACQSRTCDRACRTLHRGASHSRATRFQNRALLYSMRLWRSS